jgi:hypothetical protein
MSCAIGEETDRGEIAYRANKALEANPHQVGSLAWAAWRYGWLKASRAGE